MRPFLFLLLALASCSAPKLYSQNRGTLAAARGDLVAGRNQQATERLAGLVADLEPVARDYPLQLFYAAGDLATAQVRCSLEEPYLPAGKGALDARSLAQRAHMVAALWWTHFGKARADAAANAPLTVDGSTLLPEGVGEQDVDALALKLELIELCIHSRLGFKSRVEATLARYPQLEDHAAAVEAQERADLPGAVATWMDWALFEHLKDREPVEAYRFGVAARSNGGETLELRRREAIVDWIVNHPRYQWRSAADHAFDPTRDRCPETGEPNIEFVAYPKGG